ncbi:protein serine/threonine kinase, putative [Entamoeba invadens IP1]|uniref:Protein serine/threonine kinase, putative n=1 Tax=Entamoeba invadens IP1 TaxID=370355 RepID=A0A0A1U1P1_ENTIV|nr:protein serine/threonine kinase, putative [Entamoeba invadens IP1]ELP87958.1 protein serine/threonine kinase, putative [Entamoeba invadens IP1]|eukprot:XP_004254729.1 protein serine/threonine kinase, putative [Entamoeba invadens IP1]
MCFSHTFVYSKGILFFPNETSVVLQCSVQTDIFLSISETLKTLDVVLNNSNLIFTNTEIQYNHVYTKSYSFTHSTPDSILEVSTQDFIGSISRIKSHIKSDKLCFGVYIENCEKCQFFSSSCSKCKEGYGVAQCSTGSQCLPQDQEGCVFTCRPYNYLTKENQCCPTHCSEQQCSTTTSGTCTKCEDGYTLLNSLCQKCTDLHCQTCDPSHLEICQKCESGYYLDNFMCYKCSENCLSCTTLDTCEMCKENHIFNAEKCVYCDPTCGGNCDLTTSNCKSCLSGYVFTTPLSEKCESCSSFDSNCLTCSPDFSRNCYICNSGFYPLISGKCTSCDVSCNSAKCSQTNGICSECAALYTKKESESVSCELCSSYDPNCQSCSKTARKCETCNLGYYPATTSPFKCKECDISCSKKCSTTTGYCTSCSDNYVLRLSDSITCELCSSFDTNCDRCATDFSRKCILCKEGYYINTATNRCVPCESSCLKCSKTDGICITCKSTYVPFEMPQKTCQSCTDFDSKCSKCADNSTRICTECSTGYYPSPPTHKCVTCHSTCSTDCDPMTGICKSCNSGYVFTNPASLQCIACREFDDHCSTCGTNGQRKCITCNTGYYPLSSGTCKTCETTCKANQCSNTTGNCNSCIDAYVITSPISPNCESCTTYDKNCLICSTTSQRKCIECNTKYYLNTASDYKCLSCSSSCGNGCDKVTGICNGCATNYVPKTTMDKECLLCSSFDSACVTCVSNERKCSQCTTNYYPSPTNFMCTTCDATCNKNCNTTNGDCKGCLENYVFSTEDTKKCVSCTSIDSHCSKCSSTFERKCTTCMSGYYPDTNGVCTPCDSTCKTCDATNGVCIACNDGRVFTSPKGKTCELCNTVIANCESCSASYERTCIACVTGKYPSNNICTDCNPTCTGMCRSNNGFCDTCISGYVITSPLSTTCVNCSVFDPLCDECTGDSTRTCKRCKENTYLTSSKNCRNCDTSCNNVCDSTTGKCTQCKSNYVYLEPLGLTCQECSSFDSNCETCATDFSRVCISCKAGSYLVNGRCQTCDSTCNKQCDKVTGACTGCLFNYIYSSTDPKKCVMCKDLDDNCNTCASNFSRNCISCTNKKYALNGKCVNCVLNDTCTNCDGSNGNCVTCQDNYVAVGGGSSACEKCSSFDSNCATCASDTSRKCVKCNSGYYPKTVDDYKCKACDTTCGGRCNTENGYCTGCKNNYVLINPSSYTCQSCTSFDSNCSTCSLDYSRKCLICKTGYYPGSDGVCKLCDTSCQGKCSTTTGICSSCNAGFVVTNPVSAKCITCTTFDSNCITCASDYSQKCVKCNINHYPDSTNGYKCRECDSSCSGLCNTENGKCFTCPSSYTPTNPVSSTCTLCSDFDSNCQKCSTIERKCVECKPNMYPYSTTSEKKCISCDSSCNGQCNVTTGECLACTSNCVYNPTNTSKCVSCDVLHSNCVICSSTFKNEKCITCKNKYFLDQNTNNCNLCNVIPNCDTCSTTEKKCITCVHPYYLSGGVCNTCAVGEFKNTESSCAQCIDRIDNCKYCNATSLNVAKCIECYAPYVPDTNGRCVLCAEGTYYNTKKCVPINSNCVTQLSEGRCTKCVEMGYITNGTCVTPTTCSSPNTITTTSCDCTEMIAVGSQCQQRVAHCKYEKVFSEHSECLSCDDNYNLIDVTCQVETNGSLIQNTVYFGCPNGQFLRNDNTCQECRNLGSVCTLYNNVYFDYLCKSTSIIDIEDFKCTEDANCAQIANNLCVKCSQLSTEIIKGKCSTCKVEKCETCNGGTCQKCVDGYLVYSPTQCVAVENVNCLRATSVGCVQCADGFYQTDSVNIEGKYDYCHSINAEEKCKHKDVKHDKCIECTDLYQLKDGVCKEKFDSILEENTTTFDITESIFNAEKNKNDTSKGDAKTEENNTENCLERTNKGCFRCADTYYNSDGICLPCTKNCKSCYNATYCTKCPEQYYLNLNMECQSSGQLAITCSLTLPNGAGCAICNDGYYKVSKDCLECDGSCKTCLISDECSSCKDDYFALPEESKLCFPKSNLTHCEEVTGTGCNNCSVGYYLEKRRCHKCMEHCEKCTSLNTCNMCTSKDYVLVDSVCKLYSTIEFCVSAENSKCTLCEGYHEPSEDGESCVKAVNYGVVVGIPITIVILLLIIALVVVLITLQVINKHKENKKTRNICTFVMARSNISMTKLNDNLVANKLKIKFDLDGEDLIPVDKDTRDLICIGNTSSHKIKLQFSVVEGCDYYEIRTIPALVTLKKGEACEFELYIKPLCCCEIKEDIMVIALDIQSGIQTTQKITVETITENSTKLNYRELEETKKLGEGSFGIVYKGKYRGNDVAIKKMKQTNGSEIKNENITEFENEIKMMDKFRSEFIIHFYGAVFVPNKICMVTEFAQFGSLNDLMKHKNKNDVPLHLRVKICLDAARGISYLHNNDILHRDIKPDNFLIVSLDQNVKVNGKLTDFGSSRNVNMMMTNMTFTKGVGTPTYMAPEVLKKEKYKKPADVYSFGITMFECFKWGDSYPKSEFKFPWKIAEFVTNGNRLKKPLDMPEHLFNIVEDCWKEKIRERCTIDKTVEMLQTYFN